MVPVLVDFIPSSSHFLGSWMSLLKLLMPVGRCRCWFNYSRALRRRWPALLESLVQLLVSIFFKSKYSRVAYLNFKNILSRCCWTSYRHQQRWFLLQVAAILKMAGIASASVDIMLYHQWTPVVNSILPRAAERHGTFLIFTTTVKCSVKN